MAVFKQDIVDIELNSGNVHRSFLKHAIGSADAKADHFGIRTFRGGVPVDLSGVSVQGYFRNSQGTNIAITSGNIVDGNVAEVVLPQACYNYEGPFCLAIKLIGDGVTGTMRIVDGIVDNTNTGNAVAPTGTVPTYSEILSQYDAMVAATAAANGCTAETFDATKAYSAGKYVINSGTLYRLTADHAANVTWANTSKVEVKFGNELSDVKSDIITLSKNFIPCEKFPNNLLDPSTCTDNYRINTANGNMSSNNAYFCTDYIAVTAGTRYKANYGRQYAFYDSSKNYLSGSSDAITNVKAPTNAAYIRFSVYKVNETSNPYLVYFTALNDFDDRITIPNLNLENIENEIQAVDDRIGSTGYDLEVVNVGTAQTGGWQGTIGNEITKSSASSYRSYSIPATPGKTYIISVRRTTSNNYPKYGFFVNDNNIIISSFGSVASEAEVTVYTAVCPEGATKLDFLSYYTYSVWAKEGTNYNTVGDVLDHKQDIPKHTKYVSNYGSDTFDGSLRFPYQTIQKAITSGAEIIFVESGEYNERLNGTGKRLEIRPYNGNEIVIKPTDSGNQIVNFTDSDLKFYGITVYGSDNYTAASPTYNSQKQGFNLDHCIVYMENCKAIGCRTAGIKCDGSISELHNCSALYNGTVELSDGFNAHKYTDPNTSDVYYPSMYLFDCIAVHNGDDGVSVHEGGYLYVSGGKYANNGTGGITPNGGCRAEIHGALIEANYVGIDSFQNISQSNPVTTVLAVGNIIKNNSHYGIASIKYNTLSVGNIFSGNEEDTNASEGTITLY